MLTGTASSLSNHYDDNGDNRAAHECELKLAASLEALRPTSCRREGSLDKISSQSQHTSAGLYRRTVSNIGLTPEARKIVHLQSKAEATIPFLRPAHSDPTTYTADDDGEHKWLPTEPTLVRKKSGELVQSSMKLSSGKQYSSMTGTLVGPKSVYFNDLDNRTRHFLQADKSMAVLADSSPVDIHHSDAARSFEGEDKTTHGIRLTNFTHDNIRRKHKQVHVEHLFLSPDGSTLIGTIAVQNISFQKLVVVRFTLDDWRTTSETVAIYTKDAQAPSSDSCDRFSFRMDLSDVASIGKKVLQLCVRYSANGRDYWDNNDNMNYHIEFATTGRDSTRSKSDIYLSATPLRALP